MIFCQMTKRTKRSKKSTGISQEWTGRRKYKRRRHTFQNYGTISMRHWQVVRAIKKTTTKVQEWIMTEKSQECATMTKSQEWIAITGAQG